MMSNAEYVIESVTPDDFTNPRRVFIPKCGIVVSHDIQSGPILCGRIAEYIASSKKRLGAVCYFCEEHFPNSLRERIE